MTDAQRCTSLYAIDYRPLDELRNEIRLLTVQKIASELKAEACSLEHTFSDGATVVCCTIEHVPLGEPPCYKGLSYCWGDRNDTRKIHVNGVEVQVTRNLESALRDLGRHESVCLWVDALCINQSDLDERGRQVLRMGDIYKNASETICWLGDEADNSSLAFDLIQILSRTNDGFESTQYEKVLMRLYRPSENHEYNTHWTAILLLFRRPYWARVWIIQEIVASSKVLVRCGSRCAMWEDLVKAVLSVPTAEGRSRVSVVSRVFSDLHGMTNVVSIDALRGITQEAKSKSEYISLLSALRRSTSALATIPSDKIYALLAITKDGQDLISHPTYTLSAEKICTMTTAAIIAATADLDIICYAEASPGRILPSWVPDWTKKLARETITGANAGREDLYKATGKSQGGEYLRIPHMGEFVKNGLVLKVRGFIVDVVHGLGAVDLDNGLVSDVDGLTNYGLIQPEPEQSRSQYGSETGIFRALWMSLVLGEREDKVGSSDFLNSLYVTQASDSEAIAENVNVAFESWYSANKSFEIHGRALKHWFRIFTADPNRPERSMNDLTDEESKFLEQISLATLNKRLLFTYEGYIGMAPYDTRKGDKICLLYGCRVPFVLRERTDGDFELVGEVYVHGIMKGEALTDENFEKLRDFCIH